jgi:hypothetical protein
MRPVLLAGAAALALAPGVAVALTAAEAWQNMQDAAAEADITLTAGAEALTGAQLAVTDVAFSAVLPAETEGATPTTVEGTLAEIVFAEQPDASVDIALPAEMPVRVDFVDEDGAPVSLDFLVRQEGLTMTAGDADGGGTTLAYAADALRAELVEVVSAGSEGLDYDVTLAATGIASANAYREAGSAGSPEIATETTAETLTADIAVVDDASPARFEMALDVRDLSSRSEGSGSVLMAGSGDLGALAAEGFAAEGAGGVGSMTLEISGVDEAGLPFAVSLASGGIEGSGRVADGQLAYDLSYDDFAFALSGGEMPVPQVTGTLGGLGTRLAMPLRQTEEPQPLGLRLSLTDLVLGEEIWAMFDPAGVLPRDPATLIADIAGMARWTVDPADEAAMERAAEAGETPLEVSSLDIEELRLALSGAELAGTGGVDLDWSRPGPFGPGSPAPDGELSLVLTGGQALLDNLVRMGLLTQEDAMMTRMMLGAIARPGQEPDTLVSEITLQPDGTVLANGAPLPF